MPDPYLTWNDHIDYIGHKISAKLGMLRKARKVIPRESCLTLCNAMILSVFDYCAVVWDFCSKADREYLDKLHHNRRYLTLSVGLRSRPRLVYLMCMLVFKSVHGLTPAHFYFMNLPTRAISILITRAIEICSVCR